MILMLQLLLVNCSRFCWQVNITYSDLGRERESVCVCVHVRVRVSNITLL